MFRKILLFSLLCLLLQCLGAAAVMGVPPLRLFVNNEPVSAEPSPFLKEDRVFVPLRFVAEAMGAGISWDPQTRSVTIDQLQQSSNYLKKANTIKAADLRNLLDDDNDLDLADYRTGLSGGDSIINDPLIIDIRDIEEYDYGHIPTAVWVASAANMADPENIAALKNLITAHNQQGGANRIVVYGSDGGSAGQICGVLSTVGIESSYLIYGYEISWAGTARADAPIRASIEDKDGNVRACGG